MIILATILMSFLIGFTLSFLVSLNVMSVLSLFFIMKNFNTNEKKVLILILESIKRRYFFQTITVAILAFLIVNIQFIETIISQSALDRALLLVLILMEGFRMHYIDISIQKLKKSVD